MPRILVQAFALTAMQLRSIPNRAALALSTVLAVALVVMVLMSFLAMASGFQRTLASSGEEDVAIVLRSGSQSEINSVLTREQLRLIELAPGVARNSDGKPLVSGELYVTVDGIKRSTGAKVSVALRGVGMLGSAVRKSISIVSGRMFSPGTNEIVVGKNLASQIEGLDLGKSIMFGTTAWAVVGIFENQGSVFESEIWADLGNVQSFFKRPNVYQTIRTRLESPAALDRVKAYVSSDPRLTVDVRSEAAFYADESQSTVALISGLGWPLALAMAIGAIVGALNTMYSSVSARATEIATLRAIGFGGLPTFIATITESLLLATIGGLLGSVLTFLAFDGLTTSTAAAGFANVVFSFKLSWFLVLQGLLLALAVGIVGGVFPALHAARTPILAARAGGS